MSRCWSEASQDYAEARLNLATGIGRLGRAAEAITDAILGEAQPFDQLRLIDYISPEEMLRDLRGGHGADCDRPGLDRRMIEELSRPRR